jgi:hypothetical protein
MVAGTAVLALSRLARMSWWTGAWGATGAELAPAHDVPQAFIGKGWKLAAESPPRPIVRRAGDGFGRLVECGPALGRVGYPWGLLNK